MKLAIFSHCAIDTITLNGFSYEQIGGAACYAGLTARQFNFDVDLYTKFGKDFPMQYLTQNKIHFENALSDKLTTRFAIDITNSDRVLRLLNECEPIEYIIIDADCHLITTIFHEISHETFGQIKKDSIFTLVDPQGFLRRIDSEKNIFLKYTELDLSNVNAIKVNPEEYPEFKKRVIKPTRRRDLENKVQWISLRVFFLNKKNEICYLKEELDLYTKKMGLGNVLWLHCRFLKAKNFKKVIMSLCEPR